MSSGVGQADSCGDRQPFPGDHPGAVAVRGRRQSHGRAPIAPGDMWGATLAKRAQAPLDFDRRRAPTRFASVRSTWAQKQAAKGVMPVEPFVLAVSPKTCRIGAACTWPHAPRWRDLPFVVTQRSRELLVPPGTMRSVRRCREPWPRLVRGEYRPTDIGVQAGRVTVWEPHHDALPGCIGSRLHQVPRIRHLPRQGDHRGLQERRAAAGGFNEEAVIGGPRRIHVVVSNLWPEGVTSASDTSATLAPSPRAVGISAGVR